MGSYICPRQQIRILQINFFLILDFTYIIKCSTFVLYCVVGVTSSACLPHCLYTSSPTPIDHLLYTKNDKRCLSSL